MVKDKGRSEVSGLCRLRQTFAFRETQPGELHKWPSIALFGSFYGKMLCFYQFLPLSKSQRLRPNKRQMRKVHPSPLNGAGAALRREATAGWKMLSKSKSQEERPIFLPG